MNAEKHFTEQAGNYVELGKCFAAAASCHKELSLKADAADYHRDLSDCYSKAAECCANLGTGSVEYATGLPDVANESRTNADERGPRDKTERDILNLNAIAPDRVTGVFLKTQPSRSIAVPRTGAPDINDGSREIPAEFLDLVSLDK